LRLHIVLPLTVFALGACSTDRSNTAGAQPDRTSVPYTTTAAAGHAPDAVLQEFHNHATQAQYQSVVDAIHASPALAMRIAQLVKDGKLTRLLVVTPDVTSGFGARQIGSTWVFAPEFLARPATVMMHHVMVPRQILPDNMVFALGYLAFFSAYADPCHH